MLLHCSGGKNYSALLAVVTVVRMYRDKGEFWTLADAETAVRDTVDAENIQRKRDGLPMINIKIDQALRKDTLSYVEQEVLRALPAMPPCCHFEARK